MLPVNSAGKPLRKGVLYGVDTRAAAQIAALTHGIGADRIRHTCGNALTSQSVGPKILWLQQEEPEIFARTAKVLTSTSCLTWKLTGNHVIDPYTAANFSPLYDVNRQDWTDDLAPGLLSPAFCRRPSVAGQAAPPDVEPRDCGSCHRRGSGGNRVARRNSGHLRHHRRSGRSGVAADKLATTVASNGLR